MPWRPNLVSNKNMQTRPQYHFMSAKKYNNKVTPLRTDICNKYNKYNNKVTPLRSDICRRRRQTGLHQLLSELDLLVWSKSDREKVKVRSKIHMKAYLVGEKVKIRNVTLINNKSGTRKIPSRTKLEDVCNVTIFFLGKNKFFYFISKERQRRPVLIFEPAYILVLMMRRRKSVVWWESSE